jgi:photosystem II stability/assembly factor-like uncharacterized protein
MIMEKTASSTLNNYSLSHFTMMQNRKIYSVTTGFLGLMLVLALLPVSKTIAQQATPAYEVVTPTDPSIPPAPRLFVVPADGRVTLYWDDSAEGFVDPVMAARNVSQTRRRNFEGYKVYKATDPEFLDAFAVTDNKGNIQGYRPIAQFDRANGIGNYHPAAINGMRYWLGSDTGVERVFVDTDVENGRTYYYAVVAFTHGDALADFPVPLVNPMTGQPYEFPPASNTIYTHHPRESLLDRSVDRNTGQISLGRNVVRVTPNAGASGYLEPVDPIVERVSGSAGGTITAEIIDPNRVLPNTTYLITFQDTIIPGSTALDPDLVITKSFSMRNENTGELVFDRDERFRTEQLQIRDGLLISIRNAGDTVRVNDELSRWIPRQNRTVHDFRFGVNTRFSKLADYRVEFADEAVSRSQAYQLQVGGLTLNLPAEDVNFRVYNTTEGREIPFAFFVNPQIPRDLRDVKFFDSQNGVAVGGAGQIRTTSDGGSTWQSGESVTDRRLLSVFFYNENLGWAVGEGGALIKTDNGGATWVAIGTNTTRVLYDVHFTSATNGIAVGENGLIIRTTDGGFSWQNVTSNSVRLLRGVHFLNETHGVVVGNQTEVLLTTDGGITWSRNGVTFNGGTSADLLRNLTSVHFVDESNGWTVGFLGVVWRTSDGGRTWNRQTAPQNALLNKVHFADVNNGWIVGNSGAIFATINGGSTWTTQQSQSTINLYSIEVINNQNVIVVGEGPTILNTSNAGVSWSRITTEKRFRAYTEPNGQVRSDEIYFIEDFGSESNVITWKVSLLPDLRGQSIDPGNGDILELVTIKPFTRADSYRFSITDVNVPRLASEIPKDVLENIRVVPNPYVVTHIAEPKQYGSGQGDRQLHFTNLPAKCTIRIFNVSGQLVQTIQVDNNFGINRYIWDMRNSLGYEIPYGVYVYHVEAPGVGNKTGKFAVIK